MPAWMRGVPGVPSAKLRRTTWGPVRAGSRASRESFMQEETLATKPRVLSGIMASGRLHIGNYIGALSRWAEEQDRYDNF
ncbi:MAG TPA: hypothetical protein VII47_16165, partial [Actinomycetota bacterium]